MFVRRINNALFPFYAWVFCAVLLDLCVPEAATGKTEGSTVWFFGMVQTLVATVILFIVALIRPLPLSFLRTISVAAMLANSIFVFASSYHTATTVGPGPEFGDWAMGLFLLPILGIAFVSSAMVLAAIVYGLIFAIRKFLMYINVH